MRRGFLCGVDRYFGQSFENRKDWIEQRPNGCISDGSRTSA
jgi:hypothetical protein